MHFEHVLVSIKNFKKCGNKVHWICREKLVQESVKPVKIENKQAYCTIVAGLCSKKGNVNRFYLQRQVLFTAAREGVNKCYYRSATLKCFFLFFTVCSDFPIGSFWPGILQNFLPSCPMVFASYWLWFQRNFLTLFLLIELPANFPNLVPICAAFLRFLRRRFR